MDEDILKNIFEEHQNLIERIFYLILGRVLKNAYEKADDKEKPKIEKIIASGTNKEKNDFVKKYLPNFKEVFLEEAQKIEEEIKQRM